MVKQAHNKRQKGRGVELTTTELLFIYHLREARKQSPDMATLFDDLLAIGMTAVNKPDDPGRAKWTARYQAAPLALRLEINRLWWFVGDYIDGKFNDRFPAKGHNDRRYMQRQRRALKREAERAASGAAAE